MAACTAPPYRTGLLVGTEDGEFDLRRAVGVQSQADAGAGIARILSVERCHDVEPCALVKMAGACIARKRDSPGVRPDLVERELQQPAADSASVVVRIDVEPGKVAAIHAHEANDPVVLAGDSLATPMNIVGGRVFRERHERARIA